MATRSSRRIKETGSKDEADGITSSSKTRYVEISSSEDEMPKLKKRAVRKTGQKSKKDSESDNDDFVPKSKKGNTTTAEKQKPDKIKAPVKRAPRKTSTTEPKPKKLKVTDLSENQNEDVQVEKIIKAKLKDEASQIHNNPNWKDFQLLSEISDIPQNIAKNIINLFKEDNTIPFICRYRKELIGDMAPEKMRDIKNCYNQIQSLKTKSETVLKTMEKSGILTDQIRCNILSATSLDELDHLYTPYKPEAKKSLVYKAKAIGLELPAMEILNGTMPFFEMDSLIDIKIEGLETIKKVEDGIRQIMGDAFCKNPAVLNEIKKLQKIYRITLQSTQAKEKLSDAKKTDDKKIVKTVDREKFENYFEFKNFVDYVKPHQTMAINRGESLKVLSVKLQFPDGFKSALKKFIKEEFMNKGNHFKLRFDLFDTTFEEVYSKKLQPYVTRQIRGELTKTAEKASIEVFAENLKQLLLMGPVKGKRILGVDPGFTNGCKLALISECAEVLDSGVIYPHTRQNQNSIYADKVSTMMRKYNCDLIALGNGTACRETELWLTNLIKDGILDSKTIQYSIVSEQGVSIYSCSDVAKKEFPNYEVNIISAISIARRLNDPLNEFVKVEPKHLGVGMYQHDLNEKVLSETLDEVVIECVSFVGVDINTASKDILSHVAGLTNLRAEKILSYREENGPFRNRKDLLKVKSIGEKIFSQCAGFIKIDERNAGSEYFNILDSTWVHPESYDLAEKIINKLNLKKKDIGNENFITKMKDSTTVFLISQLSTEYNQPEERIKSILEALQRDINRDYRNDFDKKPLFKQGLTSMNNLKPGSQVSGAITNITHFGAFCDIGVEKSGLIHTSSMNGFKIALGDRVEATVVNVDVKKGRIGLKLNKVL